MAIHKRRGWYALGVALGSVCLAGCSQPFFRDEPVSTPVVAPNAAMTNPAASKRPAAGRKDRPHDVPQEHLAEVIQGLQELGRLDPETRRNIQATLDEANPETWPYLLRIHRLAMANGQRVASRRPAGVTNQPANQPAEPDDQWGFPRGESPREPRRRADSVQASRRRPAPPPRLAADGPPKPEPPELRVQQDDAVVQVGHLERPGDWEDGLHQTIEALENQLKKPSAGATDGEDKHRQVFLRVLYAIAGKRADAVRPIPGLPSVEQDYWINQVQGLTTLLDSTREPNLQRRATQAVQYLRIAAAKAGEIGVLKINNMTFCGEVVSYGRTAKPKEEFGPGEKVLLYAEIENFTCESAKDGYRTALQAWYEILKDGQPVQERHELPLAEEICKHHRLDFFISYSFHLPRDLKPGDYTFQLTVEDTVGRKIATRSVPLRVK